jgi:hypothetical protein
VKILVSKFNTYKICFIVQCTRLIRASGIKKCKLTAETENSEKNLEISNTEQSSSSCRFSLETTHADAGVERNNIELSAIA